VSQRHRHEYAADLPHGLPGPVKEPSREVPAARRYGGTHRARPLSTRFEPVYGLKDVTAPVPRVLLSATLAGPAPSGSTGHVPALSGLLPPSPAPPRSGCPQLHRPAATGRRRRSLTSTRNDSARCAVWRSLAAQLLIRRYLSAVQRRPDRYASWHDRHPIVRTCSPGARSRSSQWLPTWLPASWTPPSGWLLACADDLSAPAGITAWPGGRGAAPRLRRRL
jgi:hypothetical protein